MDLIKQLAEMAIGSRMKRLTFRMNKDVSRVYKELGFEFEARWFPVVYLLSEKHQLSITEIADALNYSHTAIKKFAVEMIKKDLLDSVQDLNDKRRRLLRLSKHGKKVVRDLKPVWKEIKAVAYDLVMGSDPNIISAIESVERQLDQSEVYERIREKLRARMLEEIKIVDYKPAYKRHFRALNKEWLNKYFRIEPEDEKIFNNPKGLILDKGGMIVFAKLEGRVVGTAALIRHRNNVFELAKMAVVSDARHRFVGTKLTEAIIEKARDCGAKRLYLETGTKLKPAVNLYTKMGFKTVESIPIPRKFKRRRIVMCLDLAK